MCVYVLYAVQLERKVVALKEKLVQVQEHERSVAAKAIQDVVRVPSSKSVGF